MPRICLPAALLALALVTGCAAEGGRPASSPCPTQPLGTARLPSGFPVLTDQMLYDQASQGKTTVVFGTVPGDDFVAVRDDLVRELRDAGYTIVGTDQESVEAEAEFSGPRSGTIRVQPRCVGRLTVRYKFND